MTALQKGLLSWATNMVLFVLAVFGGFWYDSITAGGDPWEAAKVAALKTVTAAALYVAMALKGIQQGLARAESTGGERPMKKVGL